MGDRRDQATLNFTIPFFRKLESLVLIHADR